MLRPFESLHGYQRSWASSDVVGGLMLLVIAVPEQLATSRLAGMPPITGFYAFVAGTVVFALLGSNPQMSVGADSTIAPLFATGVAALALSGSPHYVELVAILAVMVGLMVMLVSILRLGWIADFLSTPIVTGFLSGVAVIIIIHQLPDFLGLPSPTGSNAHRIGDIATHLGAINGWTVALGAGVLVVMFVSARLDRRIPGGLIGLVGSTVLVSAFDLQAHGVAVLGTVHSGAPHWGLTGLSWSTLGSLAPLAAVVALVVVTQTAATTRAFAEQGGYDVEAGQDFLAVGAGSVLAGLVGAFPVDASPPRTGAVVTAGGRTQAGALGAALAVLILIPFANILPRRPPGHAGRRPDLRRPPALQARRPAGHRPLRPVRVRAHLHHAADRGPDRCGAGDRRGSRPGHPGPDPAERPAPTPRPRPSRRHDELGASGCRPLRHRAGRRARPAVRHPALVRQCGPLPGRGHHSARAANLERTSSSSMRSACPTSTSPVHG